jgi:transposase
VSRDWRDERIEELEAELTQEKRRSRELERRVEQLEAEDAEKDRRMAEAEQQLAKVLKQLADLTAKVVQNSRNSHRPPSSDSPVDRKQRNKKQKSKRQRGAQQGHEGAQRELVPPDKVSKFVDLYPPQCENCWKPLPKVPDTSAKRYQQTEIPPIEPYTTEWRRHAVKCSCCGYTTRAAYDPEVIPSSPFGSRLMAIIALVTGVYHLSRRKAVGLLSDILRVRVSLGALSTVEARVSTAVQPAVDEAWSRVGQAKVKHTDGTSWYQAGVAMALWTITTSVATVFKIVPDNAKATLQPLYGALLGILVSDPRQDAQLLGDGISCRIF